MDNHERKHVFCALYCRFLFFSFCYNTTQTLIRNRECAFVEFEQCSRQNDLHDSFKYVKETMLWKTLRKRKDGEQIQRNSVTTTWWSPVLWITLHVSASHSSSCSALRNCKPKSQAVKQPKAFLPQNPPSPSPLSHKGSESCLTRRRKELQ